MLGVAVEAMTKIGADASKIAAIGITNQRETAIVWDKNYRRTCLSCDRMAVQKDSQILRQFKRAGAGRVVQDENRTDH